MSLKIVRTNNGDLYKHQILITKETQILLERLHTKRKKETDCTLSQSLNHALSEYLRLWDEVESNRN